MKNIILLAPPAAGKGTQSKLISSEYNIPHISTGDLLRDETSLGTAIGKELKAIMDSGALISNDKIVNLLRARINQVDCNNGYVLDGYPRNVEQAIIYENLLLDSRKEVGVVIYLDINRELALKRTLTRMICSSCFASYNASIEGLKPRNEGFCDKCGHPLRARGEDNMETFPIVFNNFVNDIKSVLEYYNNKGLLRVVRINEEDTIDDVFQKIKTVIDAEGGIN